MRLHDGPNSVWGSIETTGRRTPLYGPNFVHFFLRFKNELCQNKLWNQPIFLGLTSLLVVDSRGDDQREIDHLRSQCELQRCSDICQIEREQSVTCSCLGNQILKNNKCTNQCAPDQFMCTDRSGIRFWFSRSKNSFLRNRVTTRYTVPPIRTRWKVLWKVA